MELSIAIRTYLLQNKIDFKPRDFLTGIPFGEENQIMHWDEVKLGPRPTQEQLQAAWAVVLLDRKSVEVREQRNKLLIDTDWTQVGDVPQVIKDNWAPYRQALRDIPQQPGFPDNIQWPTKPE